MSLLSLDVGTVVKIVDVLKPAIFKDVKLFPGLEGVVMIHNDIFKMDGEEPDQVGPNGEPMHYFQMPGSKIRIGPVCKMPDDHKVITWIVAGKMWNVTNLNVLFNGSLKWYVIRTGEIPRLS